MFPHAALTVALPAPSVLTTFCRVLDLCQIQAAPHAEEASMFQLGEMPADLCDVKEHL